MGVIFQDESHFELAYLVRRLWSPDPRPVVRLNYQKSERLTVFGGLDLDDGRLTLATGAAGNRAHVLAYLQILQQEYSTYDDLFVVLDRAAYHTLPNEAHQLLHPTPRIQFIYLPAYSPECNPIEQLWRVIKSGLADRFYPDIFTLICDVLEWDQTNQPSLCHKYQQVAGSRF